MDLLQLVTAAGASAAAYVKTEDIVLDRDFRRICEKNSCGKYGSCYVCPPFIGEIGTRMESLKDFPGGILYQSVGKLDDPFDYEGMLAAARSHGELSRRIQIKINEFRKRVRPDLKTAGSSGSSLTQTGRILHLSKGGCDLCGTCGAIDGIPCRYPELALPPLEGYGIDVCGTAKAAGLKYNNGPQTVTYFGLLMFG